ncbi:MAG: methyltransferase domain-containing protein [Nocardioidaceae bacterium]
MADHRRSAVRTAVVWDALSRSLETCRNQLTESRPLHVLDLGGGTGGFAVGLAERGHRVTVVDPNPDALASLARRAADADVSDQVRGIQGDSTDLLEVFDRGSADAVLCHGVLEVVDDPADALGAVGSVLQPGGLLSLLVTQRHAAVMAKALAGHLADARHLLVDPDGRWGSADPVPRRFTERDVTELLTTAGFDITGVHGARVFADLVPSALVDTEPGAADALLALEADVADRPEFRAIAGQLHVLAALR